MYLQISARNPGTVDARIIVPIAWSAAMLGGGGGGGGGEEEKKD